MANKIYRDLLNKVPKDTKQFVRHSVDLAKRISEILKRKNISQRHFAVLMEKEESEISRWLCGSHNFTLKTISKIETVLEEKLINVNERKEDKELKFFDLLLNRPTEPKTSETFFTTILADTFKHLHEKSNLNESFTKLYLLEVYKKIAETVNLEFKSDKPLYYVVKPDVQNLLFFVGKSSDAEYKIEGPKSYKEVV